MSVAIPNRYAAPLAIALVVLVFVACMPVNGVFSPDGRVEVRLGVDAAGLPGYEVRYSGRAVVSWSRLGLVFVDNESRPGRYRVIGSDRVSRERTWEQPWGERRIVRDRHNELLTTFAGEHGDEFQVRVRVFDDGVGFRYELGGEGDTAIAAELTGINIVGPATAWWQPADGKVRYEHLYRSSSLGDMEAAHTPVTVVRDDGIHLAVHEAALVDYAAYSLVPVGDGFRTRLRPWSDGIAVRTKRPFVSPWRTIQLAPDASGLIDSDLILNLNEPNRLGDVSWIEPGKYAGIWWEMHLGLKTWEEGPRHGATTGHAKRYVDFAADNGLSGVLVEGWNKGWHGPFSYTEAAGDFDLAEVARYARERGVYLVGHHETYGDVPSYVTQMGEAFDVLAAAGVPQVKTGYVADAGQLRRIGKDGTQSREWHDGQYFVGHLLDNVRAAAERRIAVNTHEPVKDTGLRRTYPNWLTREGSRGQEFAIWGETPNPPEHTVVLAHTRLLGGPMDFTPGMFDLHPVRDHKPRRIQTTLAKQLALYVVLYSPMQMVPDLPENYARHPDAFRFIVDVPTDWEESTALAGEVGDYVVIARRERGGDDWYLGAITDEQARTVTVPLAMLDEGIDYVAEIYRDGSDAHWDTNPYAIAIERRALDHEFVLELTLAAGGGTAIRFRPQKEAEEE
ncbi:MAG: glycoside hydrolase family 97 protein [Gammaproteobacteria bacterium]|nr:glycoside hydrolase family 97 protein [Gammaproteobacteria bacterium]NNF48800.1 glycoside hydrolase family 97 protein [Woeseiaceae bacterium]MBT8094718.1 glycoside hydrolase family 97 protein [Gammaproteobacteria bacterium]MBT8104319.1 glycoside hydrolase family 97 protein [Gammaproteobacteria bacterium]NNK24335.1 glycoside hydrolase family 97 protein [Woeseiaceae bacterium]